MKILPTPPLEAFPNCMHPHDAFPRYKMEGIQPQQVRHEGRPLRYQPCPRLSPFRSHRPGTPPHCLLTRMRPAPR
jgi:hypothetical protein